MSEILSIISQDNLAGASRTSALGERGESLALDFLERQGFRIVMTNFKVPVGRNSRGVAVTGEIDIIALDGDTLCFIEVKARERSVFIVNAARIAEFLKGWKVSPLNNRTFKIEACELQP
jgi:Holliday junction resolvase-like predicted endonuclease